MAQKQNTDAKPDGKQDTNPSNLNPNDICKGNDRYIGFLKEYFRQGRPAQLEMGSVTYLCLQDPTTSEMYFRKIDPTSLGSTRSFS